MTTASKPENSFVDRHIGPREGDVQAMLESIGYSDLAGLCDAALPEAIRTDQPLNLPPSLSEVDAIDKIREIARKNNPVKSLIGLG